MHIDRTSNSPDELVRALTSRAREFEDFLDNPENYARMTLEAWDRLERRLEKLYEAIDALK